MPMPFAEPTTPRYIYINPETNQVHLLVPVVGGQEISTDNTCKSTVAMDDFFQQGAALRELNAYKSALEFDLLLIEDGHPLKVAKQARLTQISVYIAAIPAMQGRYKDAITSLLQTPSNLYSIQLRPRELDNASRVINPVFSLNRGVHAITGTPLSALYNALHTALPNAEIAPIDPRTTLNRAVIAALPEELVNFKAIQRVLAEQCQGLFGLTVNFDAIKADIDETMGFTAENPATTQDYMDALLGTCASNMWEKIPTSPFYGEQGDANKTEKFSMLTQFFLASLNVYCKANGIGDTNFGTVLDASSDLSEEVTRIVVSALGTGTSVEDSLCIFFNEHANEFGLNRSVTESDINAIKQKFDRTYKTVTATKENPHMDDFMILDTQAQAGKFVMYQGSICVDYSELASPSLSNTWAQHHYELPGANEHIKASVDLDIEKLVSSTNDEQLEKLPHKIRLECMKSPAFQLRTFFHDVARGRQDEAEKLLAAHPERAQEWLSTLGTFTDYSGRTFKNCSAYEYAYWAKDSHMRQMLRTHMTPNTGAAMQDRIDVLKRDGLAYEQKGVIVEHSKLFDMSPLITALQSYVNGYDLWGRADNINATRAAWMAVGKAQCDLPVHVINEYFRPDRSFDQSHSFDINKGKLPRVTTYFNFNGEEVSLYPLAVSDSSGLGRNFALIRQGAGGYVEGVRAYDASALLARRDLTVFSHLDVVRTADLTQPRENLIWTEPELGHGLGAS